MANSLLRAAFDADGFVRVSQVLSPDDVATMRDTLWGWLATQGVGPDPSTWRPGGPLGLTDIAGALRPGPGTDRALWDVGRVPAFARLGPAFTRAVDAVFGAGAWQPLEPFGGLAAPNFPAPGAVWSVPHGAWHMDEPMDATELWGWGMLGFAFLDDVAPGGGATVAIAGSPRRLRRLVEERSISADEPMTTEAALEGLSREDAWFERLFHPGEPADRQGFLDAGYVSRGVPVRVAELTGEAGDVVLMDPRCLHTISVNASNRARLTVRLVAARG